MSVNYRKIFIILLLGLLCQQSIAQSKLPTMKTEWFSDPSRDITFEEARSLNYEPLENNLLKVGYSSNAEWLKITIDSPAEDTRDLLVCFSKKITDSIAFHYQENGEWKTLISGRNVRESIQKIDGSWIYFPIHIEKSKTIYYARIVSSYSKQMSIELIDYHGREQRENEFQLTTGLYIGALIIITLYNIFLGFSVRDKLYYHYAVANISTMISILAIRGSLGNILPDNYLHFTPIYESSLQALWAIFTVNFSVRILNLKKYSKFAYYLLIGSAAFMVLNISAYILTPIIHPPTVYTWFHMGAFTYSICSIVAGIIAVKKGSRYARYYLLGWTILFIGVILLTLSYSGMINKNLFTLNAALIGSALEVLLLSFALADRYRYLQKERDTLEKNLKHKEGDLSMVINDNRMRHQFRKNILSGIEGVSKSDNNELRSKLNSFLMDLKLQLETEEKFNFVEENIAEINSEFDEQLRTRFPDLSATEREMCQLIKLKLSVKEIARIRNMSEGSVKVARYRIRKKMSFESLDDLQNL